MVAYTYMYFSPIAEGVHKLVSVIRAQHQAWSERLAARASRLQSTISQMEAEDTHPTSPAQQVQAGGDTQHSNPSPQPPARDHFQEETRTMHTHPPSLSAYQSEGGALHQHSHPSAPSHVTHVQEGEGSTMHTHSSLSSWRDQSGEHSAEPSSFSLDKGRALNHHHAPLSQNQAGGGVGHNYPLPTLSSQGGVRAENELPPSLLSHGAEVKGDSPLMMPSRTWTSHHDSLSIFTLSTRYDDKFLPARNFIITYMYIFVYTCTHVHAIGISQ